MVRRLFPLALIVCLVPGTAFADLRSSITEQAALAAQQQAAPATAPNPYKTPAIGLMAAGAGLLVWGLAQDRGAEVSTNQTGTSVSVRETGGSKTALISLGLGAGAGGALLWFLGENKRQSLPSRVWWFGPSAGFSHTLSF